jgi:glycerol-3-phosphate cytidylyltransferase-like family protein
MQLCTDLTIVVLSDGAVEETLGRPPVVPLHERRAIVEHVRGVLEVTDDESVMARSPGQVFTTGELFDRVAVTHPDAIVIDPGVRTQSSVLRGALQSVVAEAVA